MLLQQISLKTPVIDLLTLISKTPSPARKNPGRLFLINSHKSPFMLKRIVFIALIAGYFTFGQCQNPSKMEPLEMAKKMAESVMQRAPSAWMTDFVQKPKWEYTQGLVCKSFEQLWQITNNPIYYKYEKGYADTLINEKGEIFNYKKEEYNIDQISPGRTLFLLYATTKDPKYQIAIETLRDQLRTHPRTTEGGFWHKLRYPHQMWLDGLYMGSPFLAQYSFQFNDTAAISDVINQFMIIQKHTLDSKTGLNYHGWDESKEQKWSNPLTGQSPNFWGRAMGWYCMALVDVLDYIPENHPKRNELKGYLQKAIEAIVKVQDTTSGLWYQVLDQGNQQGNYLESTASCMFVYATLKAVRKGYISNTFMTPAIKGYNGILKNFIRENPDGTLTLTHCCSVAGLGGKPYRDGSYNYYIGEPIRDNDPKGIGPFIMTCIEMYLSNK
jgi:unsaturated rhamnogalacturonyl hydrolase